MQVRGKAVSLVVFVNRLLSGLIATSFLRCVNEWHGVPSLCHGVTVSRCPLDRVKGIARPTAPAATTERYTNAQKGPRVTGNISSNQKHLSVGAESPPKAAVAVASRKKRPIVRYLSLIPFFLPPPPPLVLSLCLLFFSSFRSISQALTTGGAFLMFAGVSLVSIESAPRRPSRA